ncbi:unnamed protein product [Diabrotica balteata]|uniref:Uncharacterized protein n=1 Tax=Diabrotica balteata TaxID=107213 RepID=A0A9N9SQZ2_DIABA|nr:unnamed protein product [Diabrotica balteata]
MSEDTEDPYYNDSDNDPVYQQESSSTGSSVLTFNEPRTKRRRIEKLKLQDLLKKHANLYNKKDSRNNMERTNVKESPLLNGRKKLPNPSNWKRAKQKILRYSLKGLPDAPSCDHRGKKNCSLLKMQDINRFYSAFYSEKTKASQDALILKYFTAEQPKRTRPGDGSRHTKGVTCQYCIETTAENRLEISRNTFINVLGITKHRVEGVLTRFKKDVCHIPVET